MSRSVRYSLVIFCSVFLFRGASVAQDHFLGDPVYRAQVEAMFDRQKTLAHGRDAALFGVFKSRLSLQEQEALKFLYAYMPLSDLADYDGTFFLKQVRASFEAKRTLPWGAGVSDELFRHFVLPCRVNNENLDTARLYIYQQLRDRVKGMSMRDAALEVNHWCHERATYQSTDIRTSAPLAVIMTGYGRCGEETTLLVSALRAMCIPARQCYTPRWAHCDDNHAWVEAWVDGQWHFLGGCEPESDLDMAWFKEPARRAMLVHTKVFGRYEGPEEANVKTEKYSEINLLSHYAQVKTLVVRVLDTLRQPVPGARVEFQLYNYAEFYPIAAGNADASGIRSLTTGLGDLLIWSWSGEKFGYARVTVASTDTADVVLNRTPGAVYSEQFDLVPPIERPPLPASGGNGDINSKRLQTEDKLRFQYAATFMDSASAARLAAKAGLDADSVWMFIRRSRGNWRTVAHLVASATPRTKPWVLPLLASLADKDLHDIPYAVLNDNLTHAFQYQPLFGDRVSVASTILCPRANNEILAEWRGYLQSRFGQAFALQCRKDPSALVRWVKDNIVVDDAANWYHTPLTPRGVYDLRRADESSRDIFFVAACRSFGIPARIEQATKQPQFYGKSGWLQAEFDTSRAAAPVAGRLVIDHAVAAGDRSPAYWIQYTLARFDSGKYHTLDYDFGDDQKFPLSLDVQAGNYLLVTGNRLPDGTVLSNLAFFNVAPGETTHVPLKLREAAIPLKAYGRLPMNSVFTPAGSKDSLSFASVSKGKGLVLAWIDPDKEPTKHALKDFQDLREKFEKWGGGMVLLTPSGRKLSDAGQAFQLPRQVISNEGGLNGGLWNDVAGLIHHPSQAELPVILVTDAKGDVYYLSEGYKIGVGEEIVKVVARMKN